MSVIESGHIRYYKDIEQGTDEWLALRCGLLTASEVKYILTPTLKIANNEKTRQHIYELAAQRITDYVEPQYISDDMLRGAEDEIEARALYSEHYKKVTEVGFVVNEKYGFDFGFSPDGLINLEGFIEIKSRRQKYQAETILAQEIPQEHILQVQSGFVVTERDWCDYISYCGGMPMCVLRAYPDDKIMQAIIEAGKQTEEKIKESVKRYNEIVAEKKYIATERRIEEEITI